MSLTAASLVAWAGIYVYVGGYSASIAIARPAHREHRSFAIYCGGLAVYAFATALTWVVSSPAEVVTAQALEMLAVFVTLAAFVRFAFELSTGRRAWGVRASFVVAAAGVVMVATGLFFDPATADPSYAWNVSAETRPLAKLSSIGAVMLSAIVSLALVALYRMFAESRRRKELRVGVALASLSALLILWDLVVPMCGLSGWPQLGAHGALLSVFGWSYVLVGRFAEVDDALASRKEELARSYDHLRLTQAEIVKKEQLAAVGELSAVIAHEVRNPLAIIKNAVSGLQRTELRRADGETLLLILDEETDRLNRLVNDLLAYARPISPESSGTKVDLRRLVAHAVELAAGGNRDISELEIELELEVEVNDVEGDEALLRHALINIVDNAIQAMPTGGTLTVSCRNSEYDGLPHVAVDFHDTGVGMDTLVRTRARDPFFTTRQSGTGLGLAIVDRVARAHGGRVEIESRHGIGTTVSFVVPCAPRLVET